MHEFVVGVRESYQVFTDGELASLFVRGNDDFEALSPVERLQLFSGMQGVFRVYEEAFDKHRNATLPDYHWSAIDQQYQHLFRSTSCHRYWEQRGQFYHEAFYEHVNGHIHQAQEPA